MKLTLYALKSGNGYIRKSDDYFEIVDISRASVYASAAHPSLQGLQERVEKHGLKNVRMVELNIEEKEWQRTDK